MEAQRLFDQPVDGNPIELRAGDQDVLFPVSKLFETLPPRSRPLEIPLASLRVDQRFLGGLSDADVNSLDSFSHSIANKWMGRDRPRAEGGILLARSAAALLDSRFMQDRRRLTMFFAAPWDRVTTRDPVSCELKQSIGLSGVPVHLSPGARLSITLRT